MKIKYKKESSKSSVSELFQIKFKSQKLESAIKSLQAKPHRILKSLFTLRNSIVGNFGFKTDKGEGPFRPFNLIKQSQNELKLDYDDKHFYFWGRLYEDQANHPGVLNCQCEVDFKTKAGKIYFYSIYPFHLLVFKRLLREISRESFKGLMATHPEIQ
jgi:hypothetical protein